MGKEEKQRSQEAEDKLKGNNDKVCKPPRGMNSKVAKIYVCTRYHRAIVGMNVEEIIRYISLES